MGITRCQEGESTLNSFHFTFIRRCGANGVPVSSIVRTLGASMCQSGEARGRLCRMGWSLKLGHFVRHTGPLIWTPPPPFRATYSCLPAPSPTSLSRSHQGVTNRKLINWFYKNRRMRSYEMTLRPTTNTSPLPVLLP